MIKVRNKFTDVTYEAIQYSYKKFHECKEFIRENMNISVSPIMPKMRVYGLISYESITEIDPTDYIIRTITDGMPLYNTVSKEIMESNFEVIE